MRLKVGIRKLPYEIFEYMLALSMILNCRSMWLYIPCFGKFSLFVNLLCVCSACMCILIKWKSNRRNINALCGAAFLGIYIILFLAVNFYNAKRFLLFGIVVAVLMIYYRVCCSEKKVPSLLFKYTDLMLVIALISLIIWFFGQVIEVFKPTGYIDTTWSYAGKAISVRSFYGIQFWPQTLSEFAGFSGVFPRNSAFFSEAPMAAFQFALAFMIEIFLREKKKIGRISVFILAIVSTFSTMAYLIAIFTLTEIYILGKTKLQLIAVVKIILVPLVLIVAFYFGYSMLMEKMVNRSGIIRMDDFIVGFYAWKDAPIFGHGYENNNILRQYMQSWRNVNLGFSNSVTQILAHGGIYLFFPYGLAFFVGLKKAIKSKNPFQISFAILFILAFSLNLLSYQYIVVLIFLFLSNNRINE